MGIVWLSTVGSVLGLDKGRVAAGPGGGGRRPRLRALRVLNGVAPLKQGALERQWRAPLNLIAVPR